MCRRGDGGIDSTCRTSRNLQKHGNAKNVHNDRGTIKGVSRDRNQHQKMWETISSYLSSERRTASGERDPNVSVPEARGSEACRSRSVMIVSPPRSGPATSR